MKRFFALLFVLVCVTCAAAAETDLSSMSYDELLALQKAVVFELMSRPEWKEVEVPAGSWTVGVDIPEGAYSLTNYSKNSVHFSVWRKEFEDYSNDGLIYNELLRLGTSYGKIELKKGWVINFGSPIVFAPPASFGF